MTSYTLIQQLSDNSQRKSAAFTLDCSSGYPVFRRVEGN